MVLTCYEALKDTCTATYVRRRTPAVWRRSTVGEGSTVDRCVIADAAIIGAGVHACQTIVTSEFDLGFDWVENQAVVEAKRPVITVLKPF